MMDPPTAPVKNLGPYKVLEAGSLGKEGRSALVRDVNIYVDGEPYHPKQDARCKAPPALAILLCSDGEQ